MVDVIDALPLDDGAVTRLRARHGEHCTPLAFLLVRPDAVRQGLSWAILDELRREGLTPLEIGVVRPHPRQLEELYLSTQIRMAEAGQRPMWWYMPRYYELAPAVAVLLTGGPNETGAAERLTVLKGPANPAQTRPGQLRYRYRSQNMLMSIVHSSEDADSAIREACLFFGEQRVDEAISRRCPAVLDAAEIPAVPAMLPTFHQIVAATQIALLDRLQPRIECRREAVMVRTALQQAHGGDLTDPVYRRRTRALRAPWRYASPLREELSSRRDPESVYLTWSMQMSQTAATFGDGVVDHLRNLRVDLDDWAETVLVSGWGFHSLIERTGP
ncbi:nucleoside-diphosphate kinase [Micromonospora sp. RP3T]|uniref:nucleoside-diphosphate kinase n=1 Tax=Micromonospora sp. RP3T TaxID=2135446 RepID=UPI0011B22D3F|nr:nucleoside-diphosphate kinase [Micromonospora sp. RP3T]